MSIEPEKISCPTCGAKNSWNAENKFRPFCSDRCKLIDLGEWASEGHKIPGDPVDLNKLEGGDDDDSES
jgi:endogenous inhibitor of DNA gyrase (YacG/DUF329 family)